ncbi:hypothetical protein GCM10009785_17240 [Brooklawnia cerclae]|uniref:Flippase GtrA n=1 Tax=Brooklawnia cerclae TaxID=349934 RepID=A0ABX0SIH3_9ACTN|nr:hypothetical protein [Brooklawnia cerclae]NIH57704.1 putative flippase GtrA [Brooklawnia cerclae]
MLHRIREAWASYYERHTAVAQFIMFFLLSNGVTVLQLFLMPAFRAVFDATSLVDANFQVLPVGSNVDGSQFYVFDYPAGALPEGGGGLAYFLAVEITLGIAQVINFFLQRNVTFRSNSSIGKAALWYVIAYIVITVVAAAAQGFYKAPIYRLLITTWNWGGTGETIADVVTMIINSAISFWVFFPIFRVIFKRTPESAPTPVEGAGTPASE